MPYLLYGKAGTNVNFLSEKETQTGGSTGLARPDQCIKTNAQELFLLVDDDDVSVWCTG